jgi:hypothetical protein
MKNATQPEGTGLQLQTHVTAIHNVYDENGNRITRWQAGASICLGCR